ncbi:MAG: hypothetical protein M1540_02755 [Candidatus Bathyarchaeota archaeon]|nr:hypothetical protein [Candidatus Bathyarchaeota archaeon]
MAILEDIIAFVTSGSFGGLPPIVLMIIPLIIGVVVGFLLHKFLKFAIIAAVIVAIVAYLGFLTLNMSTLTDLATQYGPIVFQYATLLIGILPLGIGFFIGLVIGFIISK